MADERELKRISLLIGEDQYQEITTKGLNLSWLVRDLIDQHLSDKKIVLDVTEETLRLFQKVVGFTNGVDADFEPFFREALHSYLKNKIENMQKLEKQAFKKSSSA